MSTTEDTNATRRGSECNALLGLVPERDVERAWLETTDSHIIGKAAAFAFAGRLAPLVQDAERRRWIAALERHALNSTKVDALGLLALVNSLSRPNVAVTGRQGP